MSKINWVKFSIPLVVLNGRMVQIVPQMLLGETGTLAYSYS
jgi:hypothetical protein